MTTQAPEVDRRWHRLHPATLPLRILAHARNLLLPGLVVLWFARGGRWEIWLMVLFVPSMIVEIARFLAMRYCFDADELIVRHQFIFKQERHIPYRRIHNVDLVQGPLHRMLGVADVQIQTASGAKPEAEFKVLSLAAMAEIRHHVTGTPDDAPAAAPAAAAVETDAQTIVHLAMPELVRLGLIVNRGLAVVAIAFAGLWQLDAFDDIAWPAWLPTFERAAEFPVGALIGAMVGLFVAVCLVLIGFSVGWTVLRFHDFRLVRRDDDLRLTCGLLTRRLSTIPRRRIQFLSVHESLLHRWFGRTSIRVETAGGSGAEDPGNDQAATLGRRWFVPIWPRRRLPELLSAIDHAPARDLVNTEWQPLGPRARRRMVRKSVIVALILGAAATAIFFPWGAVAVPLFVVYAVFHARAAWRYLGYAVTASTVLFRNGVWTRKISAVGLDAIQVVALSQNPFDRRNGMSSLTIDTAGAGPANHKVRVPYLTDDVAYALHADLFTRSAKTAFRW